MTMYLFDTETHDAGGNAQIIEAAFIKVPENRAEWIGADPYALQTLALNQRYKPTKPITPFVTNIHGIRNSDVKFCPSVETFRLPLDATILVCHNVSFDRSRVVWHYQRLERDMPAVKWLCTLRLAKLLRKEGLITDEDAYNAQLLTLFAWADPDAHMRLKARAHGAAIDARMTGVVLAKLLERIPPSFSFEDIMDMMS